LERSQVFVLDASVAVKWYVKEDMRGIALRLRDHFVSDLVDLEAPSLLLYEVGNALRHHPGSTAVDCAEAVRGLRNIGLVFHELDDRLSGLAANLAYDEKVTFYDAVYLALAKDLDAMLITADVNLRDQIGEQNKSSVVLLKEYDEMTLRHAAKQDGANSPSGR
jgi:predicted nucleic acid-binding protein